MNKIEIAIDCGLDGRKDYEIYTHKRFDGSGHEAYWHERVGLSASRASFRDMFGDPERLYATERDAITAAFLGCLDHADEWREGEE